MVIDEVNTVPFFTPLWSGVPSFMLIFQLAREVWWYESPLPVSIIGYLAEPLYLRLYRRVPAITISRSTEKDLLRLGFHSVDVVPVGIAAVRSEPQLASKTPTFLYVGRLAPSKRVADIVKAFAQFQRSTNGGRLWLVGEGTASYTRMLRALVDRMGLTDAVTFWGRLSTIDRNLRMRQAHALVMASVREGWGLVVTEANACGTPAVVYDVPGLRDAVRHEETGLVVECSPNALAQGMLRVWNDEAIRDRFSSNALRWSQTFSFDRATLCILNNIAGHVAVGSQRLA